MITTLPTDPARRNAAVPGTFGTHPEAALFPLCHAGALRITASRGYATRPPRRLRNP